MKELELFKATAARLASRLEGHEDECSLKALQELRCRPHRLDCWLGSWAKAVASILYDAAHCKLAKMCEGPEGAARSAQTCGP